MKFLKQMISIRLNNKIWNYQDWNEEKTKLVIALIL